MQLICVPPDEVCSLAEYCYLYTCLNSCSLDKYTITHTDIQTHGEIYIHTDIHTHTETYIQTDIETHREIYTYTDIKTHIHTHTHTHTQTHRDMHTYTNTDKHTYRHTHTQFYVLSIRELIGFYVLAYDHTISVWHGKLIILGIFRGVRWIRLLFFSTQGVQMLKTFTKRQGHFKNNGGKTSLDHF